MKLGLVWAAGLGLIFTGALTPAPAQEFSGPDLARRLGCQACHAFAGSGGAQASSLDGIGSRLNPTVLKETLAYPRTRHPGAKMPSYAYLRLEEITALVDFLLQQK